MQLSMTLSGCQLRQKGVINGTGLNQTIQDSSLPQTNFVALKGRAYRMTPEKDIAAAETNIQDRLQLICHCFGYSEEDIRKDAKQHGHSLIMDKIIAAKQAGGCNCATTNPKGR